MDHQETDQQPVPKKKRRRLVQKILISFLALLLLAWLFIYFSFNYFGEKFLRGYLQEKVAVSSQGLYHVNFKSLDLNILTGKIKIDSFELIPDTAIYRQLKETRGYKKTLYEFTARKVIIDRIHFWQIYQSRQLRLKQLVVDEPAVNIAAFSDSTRAHQKKWRVVYEDIYPAVSAVFNDFHIDSVNITKGRFFTSSQTRSRNATSGAYEFSATLRDVSVNPFSYYNHDRVFYSRDVDIVIHNVEYVLADSLYFLRAKELGFSLTKSYLFGTHVSLQPNFGSDQIKSSRRGDFFQIEAPSFYIKGIDLYKAVMGKKVEIEDVDLRNISVKIFRNQLNKNTVPGQVEEEETASGYRATGNATGEGTALSLRPTDQRTGGSRSSGYRATGNATGEATTLTRGRRGKNAGQKLKLNDLFSVISKDLRSIDIDTLKIADASFEFYGNLRDPNPELRIGEADITLERFKLDSTTKFDQTRIFYSRNIDLYLDKFSVRLRDGIHNINANSIYLSSKRSIIRTGSCLIYPDQTKRAKDTLDRRNTMYLLIPGLTFTGIDIRRVFNRRVLQFRLLEIDEPEVRYTRLRSPKNTDPRFKKAGDFFREENDDFFYSLLKKYLWSITASEIRINHGTIQYSIGRDGREVQVANTGFNLSMEEFLIDSVHGMNRQGYFYSRDFTLDLHSLRFTSPDSLRHFSADSILVVTRDSIIRAFNLRFFKTPNPEHFRLNLGQKHAVSLEVTLPRALLTGLNHRRLFLEKVLKANQIRIDDPVVQINTERDKTGSEARHGEPSEMDHKRSGSEARRSDLSGIVDPVAQITSLQHEANTGVQPESPVENTGDIVRRFEIGELIVKSGDLYFKGEGNRTSSSLSLKDMDFTIQNGEVQIPQKGIREGLIRFDSLSLSVFPFRAVLADSNYLLEIQRLRLNSYPLQISAEGVQFRPLNSAQPEPARSHALSLYIPRISLSGFYFDKAIFDKRFLLDRIVVESPEISLFLRKKDLVTIESSGISPSLYQKNSGSQEQKPIDPQHLIKLPAFMEEVDLNQLLVYKARIKLTIHKGDTVTSRNFKDITLSVKNFHYDSLTRKNPGSAPLFFSGNISLSSPGLSWKTADSLYVMSFASVKLATNPPVIYFDSLSMVPRYPKGEFADRVGHQTDRIEIRLNKLRLGPVDFKTLIRDRELHAGMVALDDLRFESYRDKRIPFPTWQRPPMPQQVVRNIRFPMIFDTIRMTNGFASYEEQTGAEPGRIFFSRLNTSVTGFNTRSASGRELNVHGTGDLYGKSPIDAHFRFFVDHPRDSFTLKATIGAFDLPDVNNMMGKLVPVSVSSGSSPGTDIRYLHANDSTSVGYMLFNYSHLTLKLQKTRQDGWNGIETAVLTELVNLILPDDNPPEGKKIKRGVIWFQRDPSKGFFNFIWKSIFSGIKSSVGFNNKIQKEILKEEKRNKKKKP